MSSIRESPPEVYDVIKPENVLISVSDKSDLSTLVGGLLHFNPEVKIYSTGGTGGRVQELLGGRAESNYVPVESFTGMPEMDGGLVKTLHPSIHAGLLGDRRNPKHLEFFNEVLPDLKAQNGVYLDVLVVNLYPFQDAVKEPGITIQDAVDQIDIGGHAMIRAGAKNFNSVAVLTDPRMYGSFFDHLNRNDGVTHERRFDLSVAAFRDIFDYDRAIHGHLDGLDYHKDVRPGLVFVGEED